MEYVTLGNSDLKISRIGFGGCPLGQHGWGKTSRNELMSAVHRALELGVTLFDTADVYGLGASEQILGDVLGRHRNDVVIATKFGVRFDSCKTSYYDNSEEWIGAALDSSLDRLSTDCIDLYQVHYWDRRTPLEDVFHTLERQRDAGKIRYYGVSNIDVMAHFNRTEWPGLVSFSNEYSLVNRKAEGLVFRTIDKLGLTFLSWGSLGQGILSGKYDGAAEFSENDRRSKDIYINFHGEKLSRNMEIVEFLKTFSQRYNAGCAQLALRYVLDRLPSSVALVGVKNRRQLEANCEATGWRFSGDDLKTLNRFTEKETADDEIENVGSEVREFYNA